MLEDIVRLTVALADPGGRLAAAQRLAATVGADALTILVHDPAVESYVPAPGFPQTLPGGRGWRALLAAAAHPGCHAGVVAFPTAHAAVPALARVSSGIALVWLGGVPDPRALDTVDGLVPLLAAAVRAEQASMAARGDCQAATQQAREADRLAKALDESRVRAERAASAKDEFLAMLGHELRNPLSPIVTAIQLLRLRGHAGREHEVIERQAANLTRLVDDLLDVSRLTTGKIVLRREPIEIADVAAQAIELVGPMLERKRQVLSVDIPPRGLAVDGDSSRLAQVLANLLANASKYSDEDRRIWLQALGDHAHVRIAVKDEGIGIPRDTLERVFDVFVQQRQAIDRSQGGLGLGLAIVRSLVALHGGTVQARSEGEGMGAEFVVELPRLEPGAAEAQPRRVSAVSTQVSRGRVLVVDDNVDARVMLAEALTVLGYVVDTAPDAAVALRAAEHFRPDVAVLDIGLPAMDGYELARRLRAGDAAGALKLVAVTGYGTVGDVERARAVGFDAHLVKPVALEDLEQVLGELVSTGIRPHA